MKKLAILVAASTLAAPAFARDVTVTRLASPLSNFTKVTSLSELPSGDTLARVTRVDSLTGASTTRTRVLRSGALADAVSKDSSSSGSALPPYSEAYGFEMPGIGKGGQSYAYSRDLPALGTLNVAFKNAGSDGNLSYAESLSNK